MRTVTIRYGITAKELGEMRRWLDHRGIEPSQFSYRLDASQNDYVMHVAFKRDAEAGAFLAAFGEREQALLKQ